MGLLRTLITLPVSGPLKGTFWVTDQINQAAEREFYDPGAIRRALKALEDQLVRGEISEDDYDEAETILLHRLKAAK